MSFPGWRAKLASNTLLPQLVQAVCFRKCERKKWQVEIDLTLIQIPIYWLILVHTSILCHVLSSMLQVWLLSSLKWQQQCQGWIQEVHLIYILLEVCMGSRNLLVIFCPRLISNISRSVLAVIDISIGERSGYSHNKDIAYCDQFIKSVYSTSPGSGSFEYYR